MGWPGGEGVVFAAESGMVVPDGSGDAPERTDPRTDPFADPFTDPLAEPSERQGDLLALGTFAE